MRHLKSFRSYSQQGFPIHTPPLVKRADVSAIVVNEPAHTVLVAKLDVSACGLFVHASDVVCGSDLEGHCEAFRTSSIAFLASKIRFPTNAVQ